MTLHTQLHTLAFAISSSYGFKAGKSGQRPFLDILVHLLGGTPNERLGVQQVIQNAPPWFRYLLFFIHSMRSFCPPSSTPVRHGGMPSWASCQSPVELELRLRLVPEEDFVTPAMMIFLVAIQQLFGDSWGDDVGVNDEAFANIFQGAQDDIGCEESFGEGDPTVCAGQK